jgi:hypothetical protein
MSHPAARQPPWQRRRRSGDISFAVGNTAYASAACAEHAKDLRDTLHPFVDHARRTASGAGQRHRARRLSGRPRCGHPGLGQQCLGWILPK